VLYLDASAIVKLVTPEPETAALVEVVAGDPLIVSSALARTEVSRAALRARIGPGRVAPVLDGIAFVPIDEAILDGAGMLQPRTLRSLDTVHLASALSIRSELDAVVVYDERFARAAKRAGLPVSSPGRG
jgi:predicted nucleic acid-binding protein